MIRPGREWRTLGIGLLLLFFLIVPGQAAVALLVQGSWAIFGGELFGFPAMGIEPASGAEAKSTGTWLVVIGLLCAVTAAAGLRYSLRELRKSVQRL